MFNLNNFKINNIYYYLFGFLGIISILILLYFWRRISNLLNSNDSLEKKNSLLKKELKNLRDNNNSSNNPDSTEMKQIFGDNSDIDIVMHSNNSINENTMTEGEMMPDEIIHQQMMQQQMIHQQMMQEQMMQQQMMHQEMMQEEKMQNELIPQEITKLESNNINENDANDDIDDIVEKIIKPNNEELKNIKIPIKPVNLSVKKENEDTASIVSEETSTTTLYSKSKLNKLNVDKLKEICINNGGSDEGTKNTLIERILTEQYK